MSVELIDRPVLALPADTDPADARRLAQALDAHGVSGVLRQLDAVAQLVQGLSAPAVAPSEEPVRRPPRRPAGGDARCGHPTLSGKLCRRRLPCFWHGPASEPSAEAVEPVAEEPMSEPVAEEPMSEPESVTTASVRGRKPAACPKCGGSAAGISRERLPDGVTAWRCQPCGWREESPAPAAAA